MNRAWGVTVCRGQLRGLFSKAHDLCRKQNGTETADYEEENMLTAVNLWSPGLGRDKRLKVWRRI